MSNKYWTDKTDGVDVASATDLNKAFDGIAEDLSNVNVEVDDTPTQGSDKPVSSNGVYEALEDKQYKISSIKKKQTIMQSDTDCIDYPFTLGPLSPRNFHISLGDDGRICFPMGYDENGQLITLGASQYEAPTLEHENIYDNTTKSIALYINSSNELDELHTALNGDSIFAKFTQTLSDITSLNTNVEGKQNKPTREYDDFSAIKTVTMDNNKEFPYIGQGAFTQLTLDFAPAGSLDYYSYITFESGSTPTVFATTDSENGTTIVLKGEDCDASGVFTPVANKKYEIAFRCVGFGESTFYIVGRVGSC